MILYATRTGTLRNLELMRRGRWGILLNPFTDLSPLPDGFDLKAYDNGAWRSHMRGEPFDVPAFEKGLKRIGAECEWVVAPDIVAGGLESLRFSTDWLPHLVKVSRLVLVPLQDGMKPRDIVALVRIYGRRIGLFLGGSTEWKLATMRAWGRLARRLGLYYHIGRVNTARRLHLASWAEAHSVDGTSASRFAETIPMLTSAARQRDLFT